MPGNPLAGSFDRIDVPCAGGASVDCPHIVDDSPCDYCVRSVVIVGGSVVLHWPSID